MTQGNPLGVGELAIDAEEVPEMLRLSRIHGTGPLVYNELLKTLSPTLSLKGQGSLVMQMKQVCMQNMLLQGQWEQVIAKCFKALEDGGVQAVLMKGFAYARMYPLPYLRSWGDLDVWVGPEQYHKACGILREAFPETKHHDEEWDELKHYCFVFENGMAIELHRVSMDFIDPRQQTYWCQLEKEAAVNGARFMVQDREVQVFDPKFDLLFCFMHSWEHFCGTGIPLKQVCDAALLVESLKTKVEREELERYLETHLKALGMLEVWKYYGYMACRAMDIPFVEWPLLVQGAGGKDQGDVVKYGERLYEQVMKEGQCRVRDYGDSADRYEAREKARQMNVLARKWLTLRGRIDKARFLAQFAPKYARTIFWQEVKKGIRRTIRREEMINY